MQRPEPLLNEARLRTTLITALNHIVPVCGPIPYRLVGTGAALLRGIVLPSADIDLLAQRREDVDAIGAALSPFKCLVAPAWLPDARQYYAGYEINGVAFEISTVEVETDADTVETFGRGPWEHFTPIPCGSYLVPTVALELRLITELVRNRPERADPILHYMQEKGCDLELLRRGLGTAGAPSAVQEQVLAQLGDVKK